jgi:hypothetical protein
VKNVEGRRIRVASRAGTAKMAERKRKNGSVSEAGLARARRGRKMARTKPLPSAAAGTIGKSIRVKAKGRAVIRQQMQQQRALRVAAAGAAAEALARLLQYSSSLLVLLLQLQIVVARAARHALQSVLGAAAMRRLVIQQQQQLVQVVMCLTVPLTVQQVRSWWNGLQLFLLCSFVLVTKVVCCVVLPL